MIVFDILDLFIEPGYRNAILSKDKDSTKEEVKKFIYSEEIGPSALIFRYELVNTLFMLRRSRLKVGIFSRYPNYITEAIVSKLGIKNLFDFIVYPDDEISVVEKVFSSHDIGNVSLVATIKDLEYSNISKYL